MLAMSAMGNGLQKNNVVPFGAGFVSVTSNVAQATTRGVDVETVWRPVRNFNIRGSLGYLDAKYISYVFNGVDMSRTPFSYAPQRDRRALRPLIRQTSPWVDRSSRKSR
jgi:outer membrane receptor protein involved in Fe transport